MMIQNRFSVIQYSQSDLISVHAFELYKKKKEGSFIKCPFRYLQVNFLLKEFSLKIFGSFSTLHCSFRSASVQSRPCRHY